MEDIRGNGTKGKTTTKSGFGGQETEISKAVILKLVSQLDVWHAVALFAKVLFVHRSTEKV